MLQGFHKKHLQTKRGSIGHILVLLNVENAVLHLITLKKLQMLSKLMHIFSLLITPMTMKKYKVRHEYEFISTKRKI